MKQTRTNPNKLFWSLNSQFKPTIHLDMKEEKNHIKYAQFTEENEHIWRDYSTAVPKSGFMSVEPFGSFFLEFQTSKIFFWQTQTTLEKHTHVAIINAFDATF